MMIACGPTSLSRLVRPDVEDTQQTGCSDLQPAELDPGPAEAFVTASGPSLSPHILRAWIAWICAFRNKKPNLGPVRS